MTTKQKAEELVEKMKNIPSEKTEKNKIHFLVMKQTAIRQALIAVDFAMNSKYSFQPMHGGWVSGKLYYEELKQEIEKL